MKRKVISRLCSIMLVGAVIFTSQGLDVYAEVYNDTLNAADASEESVIGAEIVTDNTIDDEDEVASQEQEEMLTLTDEGTVSDKSSVIEEETVEEPESDIGAIPEDDTDGDREYSEGMELPDGLPIIGEGMSGTLSNGINWELTGSGSSYELRFTGSGDMPSMIGVIDWYDYQDYITSVVIGEGITSVGDSCCSGFVTLRNVTLPSTLQKIGMNAFNFCSNLTSIDIPASVQSIGASAFASCSTLVRVSFGEGNKLTSIGNSAFSGCSKLTSININRSDTDLIIGSYAFYKSGLTKFIVPSNTTEIGYEAFGDSSLQTITFEEGSKLKKIGDYAFDSTRDLEEVVLPETAGALEIGVYAFYGSGIKRAVISSSVTGTGDCWFAYCTDLVSVTFPATGNLTCLGREMFENCRSLTGINIPSNITGIDSRAFENCNSLTEISIPDSVKEIGQYAFLSCSKMKTVRLPASMEVLNTSVFGSCVSLGSVTLPKALKRIDSYAFSSCTSLRSISIPAPVTSIGIGAFKDCNKLQTIIVEKNGKLELIDEVAFWGCYELKNIVLPKTLLRIGEDAFAYDDGLSDVYYTGSQAEWDSIVIENPEGGNGWIVVAKKHYDYDYTNLPDIPDDPVDGFSGVIVAGQKINLRTTCFSNVNENIVRFVVDNKSLATVSKDMLTGRKAGTVKVTAQKKIGKNRYGSVGECTVTILNKPQLKFNKTMTYVGQILNATDYFITQDTKTIGVTYWESAKPGVVEVTDSKKGILKANGNGSAMINAYFGEKGKPGTLKVSATINVKIPAFQKNEYKMLTGAKLTLSMKNVTAASDPEWTAGKAGIIRVTAQTDRKGNKTGKVILEGLTYGETKLIATIDGQKYECMVYVAKPTISKSEMGLKTGQTGTLTLKNTSLKKQDITWKSANESIAKVDASGKITAVAAGSTIIYTESGGSRNECAVTVAKPVISNTEMELKVGKTGQLSLKNTNLKKQDIIWKSSNESIATVDANGKVKGISAGRTVVYTEAGGVRNECIVTVK